ncbi:MAG: hypothetical protein K0S53_386 [Bacteroidetes bacterium]|jgi:DNA-directed RNA polymerase specialized sigma24 family protein|nr:hypothetical protein [Bacteroidota bacterium]
MKISNDWNKIDIEKIINQDQQEINKLYQITKTYIMYKLGNDEELFHDWLMCVIAKIENFNPKKGKFSSWATKIAEHKLKLTKKKKARTIHLISYDNTTINTDDSQLSFLEVNNNTVDYGEFSIEQAEHLEEKLSTLPTEDQTFISDYINRNTTRDPKTRMKFSRLITKLKNSEH